MAALAAAPGSRVKETDTFRDALCEYVGELRASGLGPVDTLLAVKATLRDVPQPLLERSVSWCIRMYYRAP